MRHKPWERIGRGLRLMLVAGLMALGGCAEWNASPTRVEVNYGTSVRNMVYNQLYDPSKAQAPAAQAPDGLDGVKAEGFLDKTYRDVIGKPNEVRQQNSILGRPGVTGSTTR